MKASTIRWILAGLIVVQVAVLVGMTALQGARLAAGTEVRLEVSPVDPVDLARGSYVALDYGLDDLDLPREASSGDRVYIELKDVPEGKVTEPTGRVEMDARDLPSGAQWIRLTVGGNGEVMTDAMGTWYAESDEAIEAERSLVDGTGLAVVSLDDDGDPTLVTLESD